MTRIDPGVEPPVVLDEAEIKARLFELIPKALEPSSLNDIFALDDYLLSFRPRNVQDPALRKLVEAARDHVHTWTPETLAVLTAAMDEIKETV